MKELRPWTLVTIGVLSGTYPLEIYYDPDEKRPVQQPVPEPFSDDFLIKIPYFLFQLLKWRGADIRFSTELEKTDLDY